MVPELLEDQRRSREAEQGIGRSLRRELRPRLVKFRVTDGGAERLLPAIQGDE
jgi:hypothetical protein